MAFVAAGTLGSLSFRLFITGKFFSTGNGAARQMSCVTFTLPDYILFMHAYLPDLTVRGSENGLHTFPFFFLFFFIFAIYSYHRDYSPAVFRETPSRVLCNAGRAEATGG